jgi:hypothetical protein
MSWPKVCFHLWLTSFFIRFNTFLYTSQRSVRDLVESVIKASKWIKNRLEGECTRYNSNCPYTDSQRPGQWTGKVSAPARSYIVAPCRARDNHGVQEAEVRRIQARSIDSPVSAYLTRTLANTPAPGEHTATSGIGQQSQSTTDKIPDRDNERRRVQHNGRDNGRVREDESVLHRNAPISVGVIDEHSFTRECIGEILARHF